MKRLIICCLLLLCLAGCSFGSAMKEPVNFYYTRFEDAYVYGEADGVISAEIREASGHAGDLEYLLSLYLNGPLDEELVSPFPAGTGLVSIRRDKDCIFIELNDTFSQLSGMELTVACSCISTTCLELTDASQVTVSSAQTASSPGVTVTMTRDSLQLIDSVTTAVSDGQ